jgi:ABC-type transporter Mla subunit MlaD
MVTTRRQFTVSALCLLLVGWSCNKTSDLLGSLQDILKRIEETLSRLGLMTGLLPDVIAQAAAYLSAVAQFVNDVSKLLENESLSTADKAKQILVWGTALGVPHVSNPNVQSAVMLVATAVDKFLSFWRPTPPSEIKYTPDVHRYLASIESEAVTDKHKVEEWAKAHGK